ncbi:outer membrane hemin/siderophore receptor protein [Herbaspirillum hiltneri N3]|uniref:Outer membrane hemin/siderophore receptor protein n=1 Tax=Herbaspirillum hiltneri N3 TaxID=1262470 RepID=A0ABM5V2K7_9BURK|nr:TonB-dependent receptor [Herbaspirillum hiltneri]AKZ63803.1 outer membrane hemin/siderophore receptor protein [Herbaspirillum hiltneri N3]
MTFTVPTRRAAIACAAFSLANSLACSVAQAADDQNLAALLVTASRFPNDPAFPPVGATVIGAEDIRNAGIDNVNEAIRKLGGVYGRQSLAGPGDFALDMRGFGSNGDQNMVILIDGVRLSENELSTALLSSVPIDSVERIEIVRGGSSVLYGDGATGGTIQIITKRPAADAIHGSVVGEAGSYGLRSGRASVAKGWDGFALNAAYSKQHADNYRDNNASNQENFSGTAQWFSNEGRFGLRVDLARADYGLAGSLSMAQFLANPRQTSSPKDYGAYDSDRITAFFERRFGALEAAAELSHREKISRASYGGGAVSEVHSRTTQFSPRLRHIAEVGALKNELVAGVDFSEWQIGNVDGSGDAAQTARAAYVRDELQIARNTRIAVGVRHETIDKRSTANAYDKAQGVNAWDVQASHAVIPSLRLFGKTGQSYRLPTADENRSIVLAAGQILKPQTSHDLEFGATWGGADNNATLRWFRHRIKDELFYDPTVGAFGANVNLDPTKRQGVELEAAARLNADFSLKGNFQHIAATFTGGPNAGKEMVLVPKNTASARLNWQSGNQTVNLGVLWADAQRYGGDFSNTCNARMPSYTTVDARYAVRVSAWELALTGSNLGDRRYFSQAFGCASGIYPESGRAVKFTARYDF